MDKSRDYQHPIFRKASRDYDAWIERVTQGTKRLDTVELRELRAMLEDDRDRIYSEQKDLANRRKATFASAIGDQDAADVEVQRRAALDIGPPPRRHFELEDERGHVLAVLRIVDEEYRRRGRLFYEDTGRAGALRDEKPTPEMLAQMSIRKRGDYFGPVAREAAEHLRTEQPELFDGSHGRGPQIAKVISNHLCEHFGVTDDLLPDSYRTILRYAGLSR